MISASTTQKIMRVLERIRCSRQVFLSTVSCLLLAIGFLLISACNHPIPRFGIGGRYLEGREQFLRGRSGNVDTAITALEYVVLREPDYKDSLTLLGRAYYRTGRYDVARPILERALLVNKEDEIAWLVLAMTQLRLGDNNQGLQTMKSALTLLSKVSTNGYRDFQDWDSRGVIRSSIRRTVLLVTKGLEEKENLLRTSEALLNRMDDEEWDLQIGTPRRQRREQE